MKTSDRIKECIELRKERRRQQKRESYNKRNIGRKATEVKKVPVDDATRKRKQREKERKVNECRLKRNQMQRTWRAKQKHCNTERSIPISHTFANKMQKSRAIKKLKKSLPPSTPARVSTLFAYLNRDKSPTVQCLQENGVIITPEDKENLALGEAVLDDLRSTIQHVKRKRSDDSRIAMNIITATVSGESIEKSKFKTKLAKKFDLNKRRMFGAAKRNKIYHSEKSAYSFTERKTRSDALTEDVRRVVYDYWCSPENSRPTGNKVDVKRVRLAPKVYSSHAIYILDKTQTEVFEDFRNKYPNIDISLRKFEKCKPYFVRPARLKDRTTCCCRYHVETRTVFKTCMQFRKTLQISDSETYPIYNSLSDAVNATLCENDENGMHRKECLERSCTACGVRLLKFHESELSNDSTSPDVKWEKYEYIDIQSKMGTKRKLTLVQKPLKPLNRTDD